MNTTQSYLETIYLLEDLNLIQEGFGDFVKKQIGDKTKNLLSKLKNVKNYESFKKLTKHIPKIGPQKVDETARKHISNFGNNKRLAAKELKNVPNKIKAPLCSIIAIASKDENHIRKMSKQINKQVTNWEQANANLITGILMSIVIAGIFSIGATGIPFVASMTLFLIIDLIFYILDILFFSKKEVTEGSAAMAHSYGSVADIKAKAAWKKRKANLAKVAKGINYKGR